MSKVGVIVTGGALDGEFALDFLKGQKTQCLIGVDKGAEFFYRRHLLPTHILGDFDSLPEEVLSYFERQPEVSVTKLNPVKDASDTEVAVKTAVELGVEELWILGATGSRLDHVWANVQVLKLALDGGVRAWILDEHNRISVHSGEVILKRREAYGRFFSVFPLGGSVPDLHIEGAKYPLCGHTLSPYDSLCVSNEILGEQARISFPRGIIVLMETRD